VDTEEKENTEEMRQAQAYLESVGGGPHTIGKELSVIAIYGITCPPDVTADKDLIASAQAFTKTSARYFIMAQCSLSYLAKPTVLLEYCVKDAFL